MIKTWLPNEDAKTLKDALQPPPTGAGPGLVDAFREPTGAGWEQPRRPAQTLG